MKIKEVEYIGLSAACVDLEKKHAKFFLFSDIDTHDTEILRTVTQHFARNGLSFFVYRTNKGYHVISPDLLTLSEWNEKKSLITKLVQNYYRFEVIRITNKQNDEGCHFFNQWYDRKHELSNQLLSLMAKRFKVTYPDWTDQKKPKTIETELQFIGYTHHELDF